MFAWWAGVFLQKEYGFRLDLREMFRMGLMSCSGVLPATTQVHVHESGDVSTALRLRGKKHLA